MFRTPTLAAVALLFPAALPAADWPQWRGPGRSGAVGGGAVRADAPPAGLPPVWSAEVPGGFRGGWSSPVVADGRVFLTVARRVKREGVTLPPPEYPRLTDEEEAALPPSEAAEYERNRRAESLERRKLQYTAREFLHAFDADSGGLLWTAERDTPVTRFPQSSTPLVHDGVVVQLHGDRVLRALDVADGGVRWERRLPGEFDSEQISCSPGVAGGTVCVLAGSLFGVNLADGTVRWENADVAGTHSSPAVWEDPAGGGPLFVVNDADGETVAVDAADGRELWRLDDTGASRSSPVVSGDLLLTLGGSRKGGLRCHRLSRAGAETLWKYQRLSDPGASPVVAAGLVLVPGDRQLACVSLKDGSPLWRTRLDLSNPRYTSPVAIEDPTRGDTAGGGVGLYTFGRLLAFDLTDEEFRPRFDLAVGPGGAAKTEDRWREDLNIDRADLGRFEKEVDRVGLLPCASPAVADGRLFVRLNDGLACYDLAAETRP